MLCSTSDDAINHIIKMIYALPKCGCSHMMLRNSRHTKHITAHIVTRFASVTWAKYMDLMHDSLSDS